MGAAAEFRLRSTNRFTYWTAWSAWTTSTPCSLLRTSKIASIRVWQAGAVRPLCPKHAMPLRSPRSRKGNLGPTEEISLQLFSYDELRRATDGFKEELGRGSFGAIYKGAGGNGDTKRLVAVKSLEKVIEEGEREFLTEVRSIGRTM
ncbi:hypothetical protein H6P81_017721 [Aristolochia fimbriata]|uniref:Protein kinase domain-containing protein n=1 Tax=Aristolochia fimbriata TaxID=158543 RepID=A0AAV7E399_ARIFI|nr:hypothetical protein H6P81_017721 [Aristolochia fimbriata]